MIVEVKLAWRADHGEKLLNVYRPVVAALYPGARIVLLGAAALDATGRTKPNYVTPLSRFEEVYDLRDGDVGLWIPPLV